MKILVGFEESGKVRDAMLEHGHDAWSCDLLPTRRPGPHLQMDIRRAVRSGGWDMGIFFPDCTYLCSSGLHWNGRIEGRAAKTENALSMVRWLLNLDIEKIALENPRGCIGTRIRKSDQVIHPWQFGHNASKETHLWLKNLPKLIPTKLIPPRMINGRPRWDNQTDSGQNKLGPSPTRARDRSETFDGIADAMGWQWGGALS